MSNFTLPPGFAPDHNMENITWASKTATKSHETVFARVTRPAGIMLAVFADLKYRFIAKENYVFETGAGTGALAEYLTKEYTEIKRYIATDSSPHMLNALKDKFGGNHKVLKFKEVDALDMDALRRAIDKTDGADGITHYLSLFMPQFTLNPLLAVSNGVELLRESRRGSKIPNREPGCIGLGCFGKMNMEDLYNEAWRRINPTFSGHHLMFDTDWPRNKAGVKTTLENMGVASVFVDTYLYPFGFTRADDFLDFFFNGAHPACEYLTQGAKNYKELKEVRKVMKAILEEGIFMKIEDISAECHIAVGKVF